MAMQHSVVAADAFAMAMPTLADSFCLYLWRSPELPGTLYLANGLEATEAICKVLTEDGYIVKVVHAATNAEFHLNAGRLCPASPRYPSPGHR